MNTESEYLGRPEAADYCRHKFGSGSVKTLAKLACQGGGPAFVKFGGRALYRKVDLDAWFSTKAILKSSTSDAGTPLARVGESLGARVA